MKGQKLYQTDHKSDISFQLFSAKPGVPSNIISYLAPRANRKNTLLRTIPKLSRTYTIKFDFNPRVFQSGWTNIIHLTTGGNCCNYGYRIPGVWFHGASSRSTKNRLHVCSAVNGKGNFCWNSGVTIPRGKWTTVFITQQPEGNSYRYTVKVGNVQIGTVINSQAREFSNVKVFASDNWYNAAQGSIRNLVITPIAQGWSCYLEPFVVISNTMRWKYWIEYIMLGDNCQNERQFRSTLKVESSARRKFTNFASFFVDRES